MAEGHRKRLRERYLRDGIGGVSETEILELMLFNVIPRRDTRALAERLIDRFGSIYNLVEASPADLSNVPELGESVYTFLRSLKDFIFFYNLGNVRKGKYLGLTSDIGESIVQKYGGVRREILIQVSLSSEFRILAEDLITIGTSSEIAFSAGSIVERACRAKADSVIIAHNHPSGLALPSSCDLLTTVRLDEGLRELGIFLLDHLIFERNDFISLKESGLVSL